MTQTVSRNEQRGTIYPPYRGFNSYDPPHHLPDGQGVGAYNVISSAPQSISKRGGFSYLNTASYAIPKLNTGTIKEITGLYIYGSGTNWTNTISANDCLFVKGNSSSIFWKIAAVAGSQTMTLAVAYTQTVTASTYLVSPSQVDGLFSYKYGTTQKLMAVAGSDVYTYGSGQFTKTGAALTSGAEPSTTIFQDKFIFANGYQFKYFDGTNWSTFSGSPTPSLPLYVGVYTIGNANFLWFGGSLTDAEKSKFAFMDVNSISVSPSANVYYAGDRDGTKLTGGAPIPGGWAIFKEKSIYVFSGIPGSGAMRKIVDGIGCVAPKTLKAYRNYVYFLGRDAGKLGVFRFNGNSIEKISQSIEPTLDALDGGDAVYACGEIHNGKYRLSIRSSGAAANDEHYDCEIERPFIFNGLTYYPWFNGNRGVNCLLSYEDGDTIELYGGSTKNGMVITENSGTSDDITDNTYNTTAAITAYGETGWLDFGDNSRSKELLRLYVDATESGNWDLTFKLYKDFQTYGSDDYLVNLGSSAMLWSDVIYMITPWQTAVDKNVSELIIRYPALAKFFKFRWSNANSGQPFEVFPSNFYYKVENR